MKKRKKLHGAFILLFLCCVSCNKNDDFKLIDPFFKTVEVSCGSDFEIPVLTNDWKIESVQEIPSGENILDKNSNPLALDGNGKIEAANGWLALTRNKEDGFILNLNENFDKANERKFVICINGAGNRDYIHVIQKAGTEYEIVKSVFNELKEQRKIYKSDKGCTSLTLTNYSTEAVWKPCQSIFKDVVESSCFESNEYGAFSWIPKEGITIETPELEIDNKIYWSKACTYKEGITTTPYIKDIANGNKILVQPYSTLYLKGEITYCERMYNYTLTIRNVGTGTQFDINGIWKQSIPFSSHTISYDK